MCFFGHGKPPPTSQTVTVVATNWRGCNRPDPSNEVRSVWCFVTCELCYAFGSG